MPSPRMTDRCTSREYPAGSLLASLPVAGRAKGLYGSREPDLGANVFMLGQTAPDCLRALLQVRGSPFDCAGLGSTDRMRMACKRPGVRVPLAPLLDVPAGQMLR